MAIRSPENSSPDGEAKPLIVTQNLSVRYGAATALDSVSLRIPEGLATALIGPSGCGKSTLLRCFNRMNDLIDRVKITGRVAIAGHDIYRRQVHAAELRKKVGMVFQQPNPFPKSIRGNVAYGPKLHGMRDRKRLAEVVEASLKAAALWDEVKDRLESNALTLSVGQQQRLCIARAVAVEPKILLMDEPASELDPSAAARIEELILNLKNRFTIVLATHNMQQAARISDQTAFFRSGKLIEHGLTNTLFTSPKKQQTEDYITGRFE